MELEHIREREHVIIIAARIDHALCSKEHPRSVRHWRCLELLERDELEPLEHGRAVVCIPGRRHQNRQRCPEPARLDHQHDRLLVYSRQSDNQQAGTDPILQLREDLLGRVEVRDFVVGKMLLQERSKRPQSPTFGVDNLNNIHAVRYQRTRGAAALLQKTTPPTEWELIKGHYSTMTRGSKSITGPVLPASLPIGRNSI